LFIDFTSLFTPFVFQFCLLCPFIQKKKIFFNSGYLEILLAGELRWPGPKAKNDTKWVINEGNEGIFSSFQNGRFKRSGPNFNNF